MAHPIFDLNIKIDKKGGLKFFLQNKRNAKTQLHFCDCHQLCLVL